MGAWYVFACIGMYPMIPGIGGFTINTPIFAEIVLHLTGGDVVITGGSEQNIYTKSIKINGEPHDQAWVDWKDLENGAKIEFKTSSRPGGCWATGLMPPSF